MVESVEVGLGGINILQFLANMELLKSPHVWIGDTGTSGHSSGHALGRQNMHDGNSATTGMHRAPVVPAKEMDYLVIHCDKNGHQLQAMVMKDVSYMKGANFNLCSLTKDKTDERRMENGE